MLEQRKRKIVKKDEINLLYGQIEGLKKQNAQFAEMEEKLTAEENKNFELKEKLKIAKEALQYYADGEDMDEARIQGSCAWRYVVDDNHTDTAKQAIKQIEEVKRCQEQNQKLQLQLCNECGERDDYNIPCKMIRDLDYGLQKEIEENDRYRKAFEEIEEIVNVDFSLPCARTDCTYPEPCQDSLTENGTKCMRFALLKIKDIVKGNKEE